MVSHPENWMKYGMSSSRARALYVSEPSSRGFDGSMLDRSSFHSSKLSVVSKRHKPLVSLQLLEHLLAPAIETPVACSHATKTLKSPFTSSPPTPVISIFTSSADYSSQTHQQSHSPYYSSQSPPPPPPPPIFLSVYSYPSNN